MPTVEERSYRFVLPSHWRAGARRGLRVQDDHLVVPHPLEVRHLPGTGTIDGNAAPAVDPRDRILWLRPSSGRLMRWHSDDLPALGQGTLEGAAGGHRLLVGRSVTWVAAGGNLHRYDTGTVQRLTPILPPQGWRLGDATSDEHDGIWITESDSEHRWRIRQLNCWGQTCREPLVLTGVSAEHLVLAADAKRTRVIALDPVTSAELVVVDVDAGEIHHVGLDAEHGIGRSLLSSGPDGAVHVLTVPDDFGRNNRKVLHQEIDPDSGSVENHQDLEVPRELGRPTSLAGNATKLVLAGTRGLAELIPVSTTNETRRATFITPALVSPLGARSGWDRADIGAVLPAGTTMQVTWAANSATWLTDWATQLMADPSTPGMVHALDQQLPWERPGTGYRGEDGAARTYGALLNRAESTILWLRIELRIAAGSTAPQLTALRVRYPNTSYLDYLPAIYRVNQRSVEDLRQILAPYEVMLDGIDKKLDTLPGRMDPASASDDWTDYLLGWLGFPPLTGLDPGIRRKLLASGAELLDARGTRLGLEKLLGVVTKGRYTLTDSSEEPAGWFLGGGSTPSAGAGPSRLGVDTVVLKSPPQRARAGAMVLGETSLGHTCTDPSTMLAHRGGTLTLELHVGADRAALEPVLDRLLDTFVPTHCLVRVLWTGTPEGRPPRLDVDFRLGAAPSSGGANGGEDGSSEDALLHDDDRLVLGASTRLGGWPLPTRAHEPAVLDHGSRLGTELRLL
jgi:phage tail-like protein